jgi:hypothetical protein
VQDFITLFLRNRLNKGECEFNWLWITLQAICVWHDMTHYLTTSYVAKAIGLKIRNFQRKPHTHFNFKSLHLQTLLCLDNIHDLPILTIAAEAGRWGSGCFSFIATLLFPVPKNGQKIIHLLKFQEKVFTTMGTFFFNPRKQLPATYGMSACPFYSNLK